MNLHDRMVESRREIYGEEPLFFTGVPNPRMRWSARDVTHVYIDVSGSMPEQVPWLAGAVAPLCPGAHSPVCLQHRRR